jgi:hypothetical protein
MSIKATASSAAMAVLFATGAAANLVFLSLHSWLHAWAFVLFAAISGACWNAATHLTLAAAGGAWQHPKQWLKSCMPCGLASAMPAVGILCMSHTRL